MFTRLDLPTVLLFYDTTLLAGTLAIAHVRRSSCRPDGLMALAWAYLMLAVGAVLAWKGEEAALPAAFWTHGSLLLGLAGYALFYVGIRAMSGRRGMPAWWLVAPVLVCFVAGLVTGFPLDNSSRAGAFHAAAVLSLANSAYAMFRNYRVEALPSSRILAALLALSGIVYGIRLTFIVTGTAASAGFALAFFIQMFCHFGIALMVATISKERAEVRLARLAETDPLTGVGNRRWLTSRLPRQLRANSAILQLDLDRFKLINDQFGHGAGDTVLVAFANCVKAQLRESDLLARTGGEEFVVFAPDVSEAAAQAIAERLRACVEQLQVTDNGTRLPVSTSIGVAWVAAPAVPASACLSKADEMLYEAKRSGRNRVAFSRVSAQPQAGAA
jgi:diguanylate cyclase (GGDEF)-like protein